MVESFRSGRSGQGLDCCLVGAGNLGVADDLVLLATFAGDQDEISGLGGGQAIASAVDVIRIDL